MNDTPPGNKNVLAVLQIGEFRHFIAARFFYIVAMRMITTVAGWWIYDLTRNPFDIGLLGLSEFLPAFSLSLYAGHIIDKSDKRSLLLKTTVAYFLCVLALIAIAIAYAGDHLGVHSVQWLIYSIIFCSGAVRAFAGPSLNSIIAQIVPRSQLPQAVTFNQSTWLTASVIGHGSAGFLIAHTHYVATFCLVAFLVGVAFYFLLILSPKPTLLKADNTRTLDSIAEGIKFVFKTKEILGAVALDLFAVLFGGAVALIPVFARDILHVGPIGFGWLNAAADIGAITIILILAFFPLRKNQGKILLFVVAGFGLCIVGFGLSHWYAVSFVALLCSGLLDGISVVIRGTIVQLKTPDNMRGRVSSVNSMFINSSNELGQFESGIMAKLLGAVRSVVFGGCITIAVVVITWFKAPSLRKMEY